MARQKKPAQPEPHLLLELRSDRVVFSYLEWQVSTHKDKPGKFRVQLIESYPIEYGTTDHQHAFSQAVRQAERAFLSNATLARFAGYPIVCAVDTPWLAHWLRTLTYTDPNKTPLDHNTLDHMMVQDKTAWRKQRRLLGRSHGMNQLEIFEYHIDRVVADGYQVPAAAGARGAKVALHVVASMIDKTAAKRLETFLSRNHHSSIRYTSSLYGLTAGLRTILDSDTGTTQDFVLVDTHPDSTEISLVAEGIITRIGSLPHGYQTVVADTTATGTSQTSWVEHVHQLLAGWSDRHIIPNQIYYTTRGSWPDSTYQAILDDAQYLTDQAHVTALSRSFMHLSGQLVGSHDSITLMLARHLDN